MSEGMKNLLAAAVARGSTDVEIARVLGYSAGYICILRKRYGVPAARPASRRGWSEEDLQAIAERVINGETLKSIGQSFAVSPERIRQLAKERGLTGRIAQRTRVIRKQADSQRETQKRRDARFLRIYGATRDEVRSLNDGLPLGCGEAYAFYLWGINIRKHTGVAAQITFPQWCELWKGKERARGRGFGFRLCRKDRTKGFTYDNLHVVRGDYAMAEIRKNQPWSHTANAGVAEVSR